MGRVDGKVVLISGGARGQGAHEAALLIDEGASVMIGDIRQEEGSAVATRLGDRCRYVPLDVTDESDWERAVDATLDTWGRLDVLVNNAGIVDMTPIEDTTREAYERIIAVNQTGTFLGMRSVIDAMKDNGGSIINISSTAGLMGVPGVMAYSASKWAVRGMTKSAALELARYGIRVNSVHPGVIDTDMVRDPNVNSHDADAACAKFPIPRIGRPEECANMVLFLASDESSYSTGAEFVLDGGYTVGRF
ncbi:MAG: SDR family oxidoreductase [Ilumatobacteraceae bacterium]|nr:SDR family oxidoreductase [Ilumatobacteraceae bacterium]